MDEEEEGPSSDSMNSSVMNRAHELVSSEIYEAIAREANFPGEPSTFNNDFARQTEHWQSF